MGRSMSRSKQQRDRPGFLGGSTLRTILGFFAAGVDHSWDCQPQTVMGLHQISKS